MKSVKRAITTGGMAALLLLSASSPVAGQTGPSSCMTLTAAANRTLSDGGLTYAPVGRFTLIRPDHFLLPIKEIVTTRKGRVKRVVLQGGLDLQATGTSLRLTRLRLNLGSLSGSVKISSMDRRVRAFVITNLRVSKRSVSGTLRIAPGTSSMLNDHFSTYVFSDGLPFLRFGVGA